MTIRIGGADIEVPYHMVNSVARTDEFKAFMRKVLKVYGAKVRAEFAAKNRPPDFITDMLAKGFGERN